MEPLETLISWRCPGRDRAVIGLLRSFHSAHLSKEPTSAGCLNRHWDTWDACLVQKDHITDWFRNALCRKVSQFSVFESLFSSVFLSRFFILKAWKARKHSRCTVHLRVSLLTALVSCEGRKLNYGHNSQLVLPGVRRGCWRW